MSLESEHHYEEPSYPSKTLCSTTTRVPSPKHNPQPTTPPIYLILTLLQLIYCNFFAAFASFALFSTSPSPRDTAAFTICTTLIHCFAAQTGNVIAATTHGQLPASWNCGKDSRYMARKKISFAAQKVKRTTYTDISIVQQLQGKGGGGDYIIRVIQIQDPTPLLLNLLVARRTPIQTGIHVHIVARQIQRNQTLEQNRPLRIRTAQKTQQTRRCATIRHHVQHCPKLGRLVEAPRGIPIEGVEETGYSVEESTVVRMIGHEVEGSAGEDHTEVTCEGIS